MRIKPEDDTILARLWDNTFPGIDDETQACLIADGSIFFIEWDDVEKIIQPVDRELVALRALAEATKNFTHATGTWQAVLDALAPLVREEPT